MKYTQNHNEIYTKPPNSHENVLFSSENVVFAPKGICPNVLPMVINIRACALRGKFSASQTGCYHLYFEHH